MNSFIFDYYDPIYSILLLVLIAMIIALASQGWIVYKRDKLNRNLYSFLDKFDDTTCELEDREVPFDKGMLKPLLLLARAFEQSGDYAKSINIFLYLIRHSKDDELLIYLGKIYLKAGFLERAEDIFVQLLKRHPRRKDVLFQLELIYETMGDFEGAKDAINAIEAQDGDVKMLRDYLRYLEIKSDRNKNSTERVEFLKELLSKNENFYRPIIKELFLLDSKSAWESVDSKNVEAILDILWYLPHSKLQLDIILSDDILSSVYFARGDIDKAPARESGVFAIDILSKARESGYESGDISFLYLCQECKNTFPISFERCPSCMAINSIKVEETLEKRGEKRGDTLL